MLHQSMRSVVLVIVVIGGLCCCNEPSGVSVETQKSEPRSKKTKTSPVLNNNVDSTSSKAKPRAKELKEVSSSLSKKLQYESIKIGSRTTAWNEVKSLDLSDPLVTIQRNTPFWTRAEHLEVYQQELDLLKIRNAEFKSTANTLNSKERLRWLRDWGKVHRSKINKINLSRSRLSQMDHSYMVSYEQESEFQSRFNSKTPQFFEEDLPIIESLLVATEQDPNELENIRLKEIYNILSSSYPQSSNQLGSHKRKKLPQIFK